MSQVAGATSSTVKSLLRSLFSVAFHSRTGLPLLLSAGFLLFDFHLRVDLQLQVNLLQQDVEEEDEQEDEDEQELEEVELSNHDVEEDGLEQEVSGLQGEEQEELPILIARPTFRGH
jgi:hypothetical protein